MYYEESVFVTTAGGASLNFVVSIEPLPVLLCFSVLSIKVDLLDLISCVVCWIISCKKHAKQFEFKVNNEKHSETPGLKSPGILRAALKMSFWLIEKSQPLYRKCLRVERARHMIIMFVYQTVHIRILLWQVHQGWWSTVGSNEAVHSKWGRLNQFSLNTWLAQNNEFYHFKTQKTWI